MAQVAVEHVMHVVENAHKSEALPVKIRKPRKSTSSKKDPTKPKIKREMTPAREIAFAKCTAARKASLELKRAEKAKAAKEQAESKVESKEEESQLWSDITSP